MSYVGKTYRIPLNAGGLFHSPNADLVPVEMLIHPTRNINLHRGGIGKRGGSAHVGTQLSGTPRIMGMSQFRLRSGTSFLVMASADGKLWKDQSTSIKTGQTADEHVQISSFENLAYFCKASDMPQTWDGSAAATSDITNPPSDWASGKFPVQMVTHGRGASERRWACGCFSLEHNIYVSANGDGEDFSDANGIIIAIDTGDGFGIVALGELGEDLLAFGKSKTYFVDDRSYDTSLWGYTPTPWEGGVAHHRLLVKTDNDLIAMAEDGTIYSVVAAATSQDYVKASLTKPSFMDEWIREYVDLSKIDDFHAVYDPIHRCLKFFVTRRTSSLPDTALVYFVDRPPASAWAVHDNQSYDSGYDASASCLYRPSVGSFKVYTGDDSGWVWELEHTNRADNTNAYYGGFRKPWMDFENPRSEKHFMRGRLIVAEEGDYDLNIRWWVDGVEKTERTVDLSGGTALGSFVLGTDTLAGDEMKDAEFELGDKGKRLMVEVYNSAANEDFFVSQILIDLKDLEGTPE